MEDIRTQRNGLLFSPPFMKKTKEVAAVKADTAQAQEKRKPVKTLRIEDVSCSIWTRTHMVQGEPRKFWSCSFERSWKDRDGSYRYTKSFDLDSLGKLVTVAQQANDWIVEAQAIAEAEAHPEAE
jgi:hypothetical protein